MNTIMLGEGRIETPLSTLGEPMSKENNMDNFERFWNTWPKSFRKGGKSGTNLKLFKTKQNSLFLDLGNFSPQIQILRV